MRILYVEDDPRDADLTVRRLHKTAPHFEVETVSTIEEALTRLERLESEPLNLVLADVHLSDGDGLSLLTHIRENMLPLAVVMVTGMGDEETAVTALKARADDYVVKGKDYLDRLPITLESALNHYRADAARRAYPLKVLYVEGESRDIENTRRHFAVHADHIQVDYLPSTREALLALHQSDPKPRYDVILLDFHQPEMHALEVLKELKLVCQELSPVVLVCSHGEEDLASQGLRLGASRYVVKSPGYLYRLSWELDDVRSRAELLQREAALRVSEESLKQALNELQQLKDKLQDENVYLQQEIRLASNAGEIIGKSEALRRVLHMVEQVAPLDTTVLILGETGTGKELLAHAIHANSPRRERALVKVNCATLPGELIESELFGHEKGAFTGASARRTGRFDIANGGTIFLDEVGELPLDLQAKLLRVLQEGEFEPVGSSRTVKVNVRVIAATNRDLKAEVRRGTFRSDLFYRLSIFPITVPPLRERKNDIPMLVRHYVKEFSAKFGKQIEAVPQETMNALKNYPWPGNIRELRNVIERAVIVTEGSKLRLLDSFESTHLDQPAQPAHAVPDDALHAMGDADASTGAETLEQSQYNLILQTLKRTYWRIEGPYGAAAALNIHPSKLRSLMRKLGIARPKTKTQGSSSA
ncbi:MAG TPA: sigma 54-interacting transcriptional regulator [Pyrinomonadaceae bacterium]|nr:sigma 54-interacting transcriptional regulator [Pyrinomonadaceae bacterium]